MLLIIRQSEDTGFSSLFFPSPHPRCQHARATGALGGVRGPLGELPLGEEGGGRGDG